MPDFAQNNQITFSQRGKFILIGKRVPGCMFYVLFLLQVLTFNVAAYSVSKPRCWVRLKLLGKTAYTQHERAHP